MICPKCGKEFLKDLNIVFSRNYLCTDCYIPKKRTFICEECEDPCRLITSYNEQAPEHCPYDYDNETLWRRL